MPTEHGFISDLKYYSKKKRLLRYFYGEAMGLYYRTRYQLIPKLWLLTYGKLDNVLFYRFDARRVLAKEFEDALRQPDGTLIRMGNYLIDKQQTFSEPPVVYSLGVLTDTSFDVAVAEHYDTHVYLFDPAPIAADYISKNPHPQLTFFDYGVWTENTTTVFSCPEKEGRSPSMLMAHKGKKFTAECRTLEDIMNSLGHENVDILKMDIEGAALPILEDLVEKNRKLPTQIVVEFERYEAEIIQFCEFYVRVQKLMDAFTERGYQVYNLPRRYHKYNCLELLFTKRKSFTHQ
ncbi:FkbM family methyltransferase [Alteromonas sp. H39]|uniref:FkbM family methyltransferase n=1 Tax=Alteromonas sp. H39 TaxID=3389876 RepID=UPI0039DF2DC0